MLYEVITDEQQESRCMHVQFKRLPSPVGQHLDDEIRDTVVRLFIAAVQPNEKENRATLPIVRRRITSYNVCYTKLLRIGARPGLTLRRHGRARDFCYNLAHAVAEVEAKLHGGPNTRLLKKSVMRCG